jgi:hypothetical protein
LVITKIRETTSAGTTTVPASTSRRGESFNEAGGAGAGTTSITFAFTLSSNIVCTVCVFEITIAITETSQDWNDSCRVQESISISAESLERFGSIDQGCTKERLRF